MKLDAVTLDNLAGGHAAELFEHELRKVLADVDNPNTPARGVRTITLTVSLKPAENRETAEVIVSSKVKLPGFKPAGAMIHLAHRGGQLLALGADPRQIAMDLPPTTPALVEPEAGEEKDNATR